MACRILYLVGQLRAGGLEHQLYCLLHAMDRERYQPCVVVWNYREDDLYLSRIRSLGVPLYGLTAADSKLGKMTKFRRLVRHLNPEVVHSYSFYTNFGAWWATRGTRAIAVGAVQSDFTRAKRESGPLLGSLSARWPRLQIFNSFTAAKNALASKSIFAPKRLCVVPNGVDLTRFHPVRLSENGRPCIVGVGSLSSVKRWDRLLLAARALKDKRLDFFVRVIGDGPLREPLEKQARGLHLSDCVEFMGQVDDVPSFLAKGTFLAHTSDTEGRPNVVIEAMSCGRAVVAMDAGDIPSLVEDGKTGYVVSRGDNRGLVERMATLISDRELCQRMGEAGRAKAEREFGLDRLLSETFAVYRAGGWIDCAPVN